MELVIVLYILIPVLCLLGVRKRELQENQLDKDATLAMRGVGMILIVFNHLAPANICGATYLFYISGMVGSGVCFLLSGYGLHISYTRKKKYLDNFWLPKVLRLMLPYLLTYILHLGILTLIGERFDLSTVAKEFLAVTLPDATLWYLKIQFLMYIAFFIAYRFFKEEWMKIAAVFGIAGVYIVMAVAMGLEAFWYNSCLFFPLGLVLAAAQDRILPKIRQYRTLIIATGLFAFLFAVIYVFGRMNMDMLIDSVYTLSFCVMLLWFVQKFTGFRVLTVLGKYSIELYLIHTVIDDYFNAASAYTYILLPLISIVLAFPVRWISNKIFGMISPERKCVTKQ